MLQIERQEQILALLAACPALRIGELAKRLYTSEATVRRDLALMEQKGLVERVYGGVTLKKEDMPLDFRHRDHAAAKEEIAAAAAALIREGQTVFLDSSSTAQHLIPYLMRFRNLTVITNSHSAVEALTESKLRVICTGGELVGRNRAFVGGLAEDALRRYCPDIAFFSSQGIGLDGEITDASEEETSLRRVALERALSRVFLCDSSKVGKKFFCRLSHVLDMDCVITDSAFPREILGSKG